MAGVNKVILVGHLGKDPEIRVIESGRKVANFSLATTESYKNKNGERVDNTEWHNIVFWGPVAEVIEKYLKKGSQVYIEGKLRTRSYEDKDKIKKYITEVLGGTLTMLGRASEGGNTSNSPERGGTEQFNPAITAEDDIDDLPF